MELEKKTVEIGFSNLLLQYSQNIPIVMKRFNIPVDSTRDFTRHGKNSTLLSTGGTYSTGEQDEETKKLNLDTKLKGVIKC